MKAYIDICEHIGVPPRILLLSWAVGFLGCSVSMFLQMSERYRDQTIYFLPLVLVPHVVVQIYAKGSRGERAGKVMIGALLFFACVFFPGGALGALLAQWLK